MTNPDDAPRPLLAQRDFAALWWGQLISILGERLSAFALIGLVSERTQHLTDLAHAPGMLAALQNASVAPVLLFAPFTGAWVDRWNLRRVLIVSDLLRAVLVLLLPPLYAAGQHMTPVYVIVFLLFTCNVFFTPTKSAITPEIVGPTQLLAANTFLALAGVLATTIGAPLGGWMVDRWGWERVIYINSITYLVSVVSLWRVRYTPHPHHAERIEISLKTYVREVGEGWRLVSSNAQTRLALLTLAAVWVGGGFLNTAGNPHVQRATSEPGLQRVGVLLLVLGIGSAVGTWWVNAGGRRVPRAWLLGGGLIVVGAGLAVFAMSSRYLVFALAGLVIGLAAAPAFVFSETLLQEGTEPRQRGRVFSARDFVMRLVFTLGGNFAALVTRSQGTRPALLVCAVLVAAAGATAFAWSRAPARARPTPPASS